jgi:hypothetical protein
MATSQKKLGEDEARRANADVVRNFQQRREAVVAALKEAPASRHLLERNELTAANAALAASQEPERQTVAASFLSGQEARLEQRQRNEVQFMQKAVEMVSRLLNEGAIEVRQADSLLKRAAEMTGNIHTRDELLLAEERNRLKDALNVQAEAPRAELLHELDRGRQSETASMERDFACASAALDRQAALAENELAQARIDDLKAASVEATENDIIRQFLRPETIQDLANEAVVPGSARLTQVTRDDAIQRVKGALAEGLAAADAHRELAQENQSRSLDRQLFLLEGDRIRDEKGKKLTDGLVVWRDTNDRLRVWKALEVKAGPASARELNRSIEKLTADQDKELRRYAADLARDRAASEGWVDAERLMDLTRQNEESLRSNKVQAGKGQREKTTERLDNTERIYVDGRRVELAIDRDRRLKDIVAKVSTDDALRRDAEVHRLGVRSMDLEAVARAFVDELLRQKGTV